MPTYEYACSACNNEWEFEQSIKDDPIKECPKCHEQTARRQISRGTGFILKGSGWYSDLYSSPSNNKPSPGGDDKPTGTKTSTESPGSTDSSSSSKSESTSTSPSPSPSPSPGTGTGGGNKGSAAAA
jgi:putative FmdB family regulatory protein